MELFSNFFQIAVTLLGFCMSGIRYLKDRKQTYFLLTCFYGCFALGSLYWTLYLLLFSETPQVFYVSEFGWVASVVFLHLLQYTLSSDEERRFSTGKALIAPLIGVPLCVFYCTFGDVLSNLLWCGMMIVVSYHSIRGLALHRYRREQRVRCGISTLGYCAMWRWSMLFGSPAACGRAIPFPLPIAGLIFCLQAACLHCCQPQERRCRYDIY